MGNEFRGSLGRAGAVVALAVLLGSLPPVAAHGSVETQMEGEVVTAINAERQTRGLAPLANTGNIAYARERARAQPDRGLDGHAGFRWQTAAGDPDAAAMENLAWSENGNGARHAVRRWMESDGHRLVILAANADVIAVGVDCREGHWAVVVHVVWYEFEDHVADTQGSAPPAQPRHTDSSGTDCRDASSGEVASDPPEPAPTEAPTPVVRRDGTTPPPPHVPNVADPVDGAEITRAERRRAVIVAALDRYCGADHGQRTIPDRSAECLLGFELAYRIADGDPLNVPTVQTLHGLAAIRNG